VSQALRALHRRGLVKAWAIPRWQYLRDLAVQVRQALEDHSLVALPVPGKRLVAYALTDEGERIAQEILTFRRPRTSQKNTSVAPQETRVVALLSRPAALTARQSSPARVFFLRPQSHMHGVRAHTAI